MGILWNARDIKSDPTLLGRESELSRPEQDRLLLIDEIRKFSETQLGLSTGDAYTTFYQVPDDAISHVVSASHPLALIPYRWKFPIVGEVTYKGYFDKEDADELIKELNLEGWDTSVRKVGAFSTLGYMKDPVLSTMLDDPIGGFTETIIHELTHRTLYFDSSTALNESFATVVGRRGAEIFLAKKFGPNSTELRNYLNQRNAYEVENVLFLRLRNDLDSLYRSELPEATKLKRKQDLFARTSKALSLYYRSPIELKPSNASLLSRQQYDIYVPMFEALLTRHSGDVKGMVEFLKKAPTGKDLLPSLKAASGLSRKGP